MHQADLFLVFTSPLETAELKYMIGGSVASMVYGEPRLTNDIDIILELDHRRAGDFVRAFPGETYYCPPDEVVVIEARRAHRGHFNIIHHETGYKADVYLCGCDALQSWGMAHRRPVEVTPGTSLWIAPPEYVILRKLEYFKEGGSEKHKHDILGMLDVSGEALDTTVMEEWTTRLGVSGEWSDLVGER